MSYEDPFEAVGRRSSAVAPAVRKFLRFASRGVLTPIGVIWTVFVAYQSATVTALNYRR